ncbi:flagellar assembly protein FliW [Clostridium sp. DL1XJH146]
MLVKSRFLGELQIEEDKTIEFEDGILGFEEYKNYCIVPIPQKEKFYIMQSIEDENISFILINPWDSFEDYEIDIEYSQLKKMAIEDSEQLAIYSIVSFKKNGMTANLLAPIVINADNKKGAQIVLHSSKYTTKHIIPTSQSEEEQSC